MSDTDPVETTQSWQAQARMAARVMLQADQIINAPRSTRGVLHSYLLQIERDKQVEAADALRLWTARYFGADAPRVSDELIGVTYQHIVDPSLRGRPTKGRWAAPGMTEAIAAVRAAEASGLGKHAACRAVAAAIESFYEEARIPIDPQHASTHARSALASLDNLERRLYDATRRAS